MVVAGCRRPSFSNQINWFVSVGFAVHERTQYRLKLTINIENGTTVYAVSQEMSKFISIHASGPSRKTSINRCNVTNRGFDFSLMGSINASNAMLAKSANIQSILPSNEIALTGSSIPSGIPIINPGIQINA
jgi:hypothetical protein